jgi:UDP-N-acetylmuramoyl-L-alanyl-D-glutamate--2,6-diaminopimelate ligase
MFEQLKRLYHLLIAVYATIRFGFPARKLTVIGVTGTDGKTTTTTLIYEILKTAGLKTSMITSVCAVIAGKSYDTGFHVTTPDAYWIQKYLREAVDHGDTHMVLEVTSHALAQHRVFGIPFFVGVITNVTHEHLDYHKTYETYLQVKMSLIAMSQYAVVNQDEKRVYEEAIRVHKENTIVSYGIKSKAHITPKNHIFTAMLPGEFNVYNCLAALAASQILQVSKKVAIAAVENFSGVPGRMEVVCTKPFTVIVDFAHTPNAIMQALTAARAMTHNKLIHVFGSAALRDVTKRPLMGEASAKFADVIVLTEEDYRTENVHNIIDDIRKGIPEEKEVVLRPDREDAVAYALSVAQKGDVVILTGKGHEKSLCRGTVEYPWSDQEAVKRNLQKLHITWSLNTHDKKG